MDQLGAIKTCFVGDHRRVRYPAGNQHVDRDPGPVEVLRHNRAERLECCLGRAVGWEAQIYHRAEAGRDIDDPTPSLAHHRIISPIGYKSECAGAVNRHARWLLTGFDRGDLDGWRGGEVDHIDLV